MKIDVHNSDTAWSLETQAPVSEISIPMRDALENLPSDQPSTSSGGVQDNEVEIQRSFNFLWNSITAGAEGKHKSERLFFQSSVARESPKPWKSPRSGSSQPTKSPAYYHDNGEQVTVRHFKERKDGMVIGLLEDGAFVVTSSQGLSRPCSGVLEEEEDWKFERQKSEVVRVVPEVQADGSHIEQLANLFDVHEDGLVNRDELTKALSKSALVNKVKLKDNIISELVDVIMEELDMEGQGVVHVEDIAHLMYGEDLGDRFSKVPTYNNRAFSGRSRPAFTKVDTLEMRMRPSGWDWLRGLMFSRMFREEALFFLLNNWKILSAVLIFALVNVSVCTVRYLHFRNSPTYKIAGEYICIAKAGAELAKINMALLLFVVCRWTVTFLRGTLLHYVVPFDDNLLFHKMAVCMVLIGSLLHTVAIMAGVYVKFSSAESARFDEILGSAFNHQQPSYPDLLKTFNGVTGFLLWAVLLAICLISPNQFRQFFAKHQATAKLASFNTFWWTHYLAGGGFLLLSFYHGTHKPFPQFPDHDTWQYLAGPVFLYFLEKVNKFLFTRLGQKALDVIQVEILPGSVLCLHLSNPPFKFQSGMYVYLQCPAVSTFEWHPFSITSAPSDFELTLHIRAVGDWTNAMLEFWKSELEKAQMFGKVTPNGTIIASIGPTAFLTRFRYPRVNVDGPHGTPTQDYDGYRVIMLVGAGIGVTPVASVVRDVLHKSRNRQKYPGFRVEKVHFFWTTREQESFEWFRHIMTQAAEEDEEGIVDMHNYLTSAYGDDDPRSFLLKAAQDRFHAKTGHDIITNARTKVATHFARPDWNAIFKAIAQRTPDTAIGVFFCGPRALQMELQENCKKHTMRSQNGTVFVFHTENF